MSYDINIHIGQQIENFLNALVTRDDKAAEDAKKNLLAIYNNTNNKTVINAVEIWDNERDIDIGKIFKKANEAMRTMLISKNDEQMFIDAKEIEVDCAKALYELDEKYKDKLRNLMLRSVKSMYEPGITDEAVSE